MPSSQLSSSFAVSWLKHCCVAVSIDKEVRDNCTDCPMYELLQYCQAN